jgi:hypothetical protein
MAEQSGRFTKPGDSAQNPSRPEVFLAEVSDELASIVVLEQRR